MKIGSTTKDPNVRLKSLQTGSPVRLRVIAVKRGIHHEHDLHELFAPHRLEGEWFSEQTPWLMLMLGVDSCPDDRHQWGDGPARVAVDGMDEWICRSCATSELRRPPRSPRPLPQLRLVPA